MTTFLFTMVLLVTGPSISNVVTNEDVTTNSDYSKVKVIVTEKNVPLAGVFVKVTQGIYLGETITDENGQAIILCKHLQMKIMKLKSMQPKLDTSLFNP